MTVNSEKFYEAVCDSDREKLHRSGIFNEDGDIGDRFSDSEHNRSMDDS